MASQKKILLDNAWVSWANAIRYCDQIRSGRITLEIRKNFVSSLQNALELFFKQIMLDKCDYRVAEPKQVDKDGNPAKPYYTASDLNKYFEQLDVETRNKFVSIEFHKFYDLHKELLQAFFQSGDSYKEQLKKVNELRNNETHFYIKKNEYLTETEFLSLYNFMTDFYNVLQKYGLLPFWGEADHEHKKLDFNRDKLTAFSYKKAVKTSSLAQEIKQKAASMEFEDYPPLSVYEMASAIASQMPDESFDEIWECVEVLDQLQMIEVVETGSYEEDDYNPEYDYMSPTKITHYTFAFVINY